VQAVQAARYRNIAFGVVWLGCMGSAGAAFGATETVLYAFGSAGATTPGNPVGKVLLDAEGNIRGTTRLGGTTGNGTEYRLTQAGSLTVVYSFTAVSSNSLGSLIADAEGNLYGASAGNQSSNNGAVFATTPVGKTQVVELPGSPGPSTPASGLASDHLGSLVGVSSAGGDLDAGTIYQVNAAGAFSVLLSFGDYPSLGGPAYGALVSDVSGNLYGVSRTSTSTPESLYRVSPSGAVTILHSFTTHEDGCFYPAGELTIDHQGNLYGVTDAGGRLRGGCVYEYTTAGAFSVLYSFPAGEIGPNPTGGLALDSAGNLYGTTTTGALLPGDRFTN
jgi:uncharacterized repeat protein (TIGR03803 family)